MDQTSAQTGFGMIPQTGFGMIPQTGFGMIPQTGFWNDTTTWLVPQGCTGSNYVQTSCGEFPQLCGRIVQLLFCVQSQKISQCCRS